MLIARTERLPDDAHLFGSWGARHELAAQTAELLQIVALELARLGGVKASKLPKFRPIPRPRRGPGADEPRRSPAGKVRDLARTLAGRGKE